MLFGYIAVLLAKFNVFVFDEIMQDAVEKLYGKEDVETRVQIHFAKLADGIQQQAAI